MTMRHRKRSPASNLPAPSSLPRSRGRPSVGELLAETVRHEGGRPPKNGDTVSPLPDGIEKMQIKRVDAL